METTQETTTNVTDSGAVGQEVNIEGTYAAGRDLTVNTQIVESLGELEQVNLDK